MPEPVGPGYVYQPDPSVNLANPMSEGYQVTRPISNEVGWNAYLVANDNARDHVKLWVTDISIDFAVSGSTAQSRRRRTFFARNFVQPVVTVTGQTHNQLEYHTLSEFVRKEQVRYINPGGVQQTTRLVIKGGNEGQDNQRIFRVFLGGAGNDAVALRGLYHGLDAYGYITSMPQGAEAHINAPPFEFQFVVSQTVSSAVMRDDPVQMLQLKNWNELFKSLGDRWVVKPNLAHPFDTTNDQPLDRPPVAPGPGGTGNRPT